MTDALKITKEQSEPEVEQLKTYVLLMTLMAWQEKRRNQPPWWIAWIRLLQPLAWKLVHRKPH